MSNTWFQVDRKGLAEIARRRGMAFIITEPIQNAWDEDVKQVGDHLTHDFHREWQETSAHAQGYIA